MQSFHSLDEELSDEASGLETTAGCSGVGIMPPMPSFEDDSDAHLSDLDDDIKEYIATKKEVCGSLVSISVVMELAGQNS